uniref:NADH-ubiquinone oxidoreductase chain 3 n=1 Tax=Aplidium conicum TaxID=286149 RepID=D1GKZ5_APLCO|nr:NADH dehydrogenase subunit 3 [Aplidium conicum]CAX68849.1 NADH dehydrogenase subunit 3 [Aplidium conicum]
MLYVGIFLLFSLFFFANLQVVILSLMIAIFLLSLGIVNLKGVLPVPFYGGLMKYECGYTEINSYIIFYTMQFFMVALSFLLFDMEIILMLPFLYVNYFSFVSAGLAVLFLGLLMLGLLYEVFLNVFSV